MLRRLARRTQRTGHFVRCTVEEVKMGKATVRLFPSGPRLTNLSVINGMVVAGEQAIVDYSGGTPPVVRPENYAVAEPTVAPVVAQSSEIKVGMTNDVSFSFYGTNEDQVSYGEEINLSWVSNKFDTSGFLQGGKIIMPYDGFYFAVAMIGFFGYSGTSFSASMPSAASYETYRLSTLNKLHVKFTGSTYGFFAEQENLPLDTAGITALIQVSGIIQAIAGEELMVSVLSEYANPLQLEQNGILYPRVMGFRLSDGSFETEQTIMGMA